MIRIASVPASHVYVRHLTVPDGEEPTLRLPDPIPEDGRKVPGGWWPPVMLDPAWISSNHRSFDAFHIHFGFDAIARPTMDDIVHELRTHNIPLIYTVHDLRNPHHPSPGPHRELLDVLIPAADELITLTPGAAECIAKEWDRDCTVLPHPHVIAPEMFDLPRSETPTFTVGVHVKSLRPNMDPFPVLDTLSETIKTLPGARLRINVHNELLNPENHWYAPEAASRLIEYGGRSGVDVVIHEYFSDDELWEYLMGLSVSVLPYRFGTHSGWMEACHDLGTAVIVPSCGYYSEQQNSQVYGFDEHHFDAASLDLAVRRTYGQQPDRATWASRARQRRGLSKIHHDIYERALG
ncbi:glycosyltransferase family 1 protein [Rhodococcus globerulus]|uniref:glycosyltransferase family 1 protein n=1 Tax=Rhodococcus globerulus TaxID=33008 RepID=UPI000AC23F53|nr:glycosyltransferase family 1 protein [Rhodococcus globerulus]